MAKSLIEQLQAELERPKVNTRKVERELQKIEDTLSKIRALIEQPEAGGQKDKPAGRKRRTAAEVAADKARAEIVRAAKKKLGLRARGRLSKEDQAKLDDYLTKH